MSFYFPAFHIVALIVCFAHGEGLTRECAVLFDVGEKLAFLYAVEEEADCVGLIAETAEIVFAVYIVDLTAVFFYVFINKALKNACGKTVHIEAVLFTVYDGHDLILCAVGE